MNGLRASAYASAALVYILIVVGGYVSATGSGLACPDWPLCHGQIIPPLIGGVLIEYAHRLVALLTGLLITATMILAVKSYGVRRRMGAVALLAFVLLVAQVLLGMLTVQSRLEELIATAHLGLATAVFGVVLISAVLASRLPR